MASVDCVPQSSVKFNVFHSLIKSRIVELTGP